MNPRIARRGIERVCFICEATYWTWDLRHFGPIHICPECKEVFRA